MPAPRRVLGYARVSSAEQALGTSLRDQQEAIRTYAQARGVGLVLMYVEAESAVHEKIERREQIQALLREVRSGDLVVCDKLDRWSRDPEFTHGSVGRIKAAGAAFFAVAENLDASTHEGDFMLGIRAVLAKEEHRRIRIRTVGTRKILRDQGLYVEGLPPLGYRRGAPRGAKSADKNVLVIVPDEADVVRAIFRRYVAGRSMTQLAGDLGLSLDRVKDALHRRLYTGEVQNARGEWIRGRHEAIVEPALFLRAQETIARRKLGGPRVREQVSETSTWVLRDVAVCFLCGAKMGAAYAGPKDERRRHYYRCVKRCQSLGSRANNSAFVPVREVEDAAAPMVLARLADLRDELGRGPEPATSARAVDFGARRDQLAARRERVLMQFEDGAMDRDRFRARIATLDAERMRIDAEEQAAARPAALADATVRRELLGELRTIQKAWRQATPQDRRTIVNLLALAVRVAKGREPRFVWRSAEELAADVRA